VRRLPRLDGTSWSAGAQLGTGGNNTVSAVAYEQQSGSAMATYGKGFSDANVYYQMWNGATWSGESSVSAPSGFGSSDNPTFTSLASDPRSDRILLGVTTPAARRG